MTHISPSSSQGGGSQHDLVLFRYGLFMVAWSVLETVIQAAIQRHLGVDVNKAVIVTGKLQFNPRVQLLIGLLKSEGVTHQEAIKLLGKIEGFAQRNTLVHGNVIVGVPEQLTFIKYDGGSSIKRSFTADELAAHIVELMSRTEKLQELLAITDANLQEIGDATLAHAK